MPGSAGPELEAYLEWLRQRVLGWVGRPLAEGEAGLERPYMERFRR